jgi:HEAT repeat protein
MTEMTEILDRARRLAHDAGGAASAWEILLRATTLPMAGRSDLEGRVLAILDPRRNRRSLKRKTCYALVLAALLFVVPCAILRLGYAEDKKAQEASAARNAPAVTEGTSKSGPAKAGTTSAESAAPPLLSAFGTVVDPAGKPVKEPSFEGRTMSEWAVFAKDEDPEVRKRAFHVLEEFGGGFAGPGVVPGLVALLKDQNAEIRLTAIKALESIESRVETFRATGFEQEAIVRAAWTEALRDRDPAVREEAAKSLGNDHRRYGAKTKTSVPALIAALADEQAKVRAAAAGALAQMGPDANTATAALTGLLNDKEAGVRAAAAGALGQMGPDAKMLVPTFTALLDDKDAGVRVAAAGALGGMGPDAKTAVPALAKLLKDENYGVWCAAAGALGGIGPEARTALRPLLESLAGKENMELPHAYYGGRDLPAPAYRPRPYEAAEPAFAAFRKMGPSVVPTLVEWLSDKDERVRRSAAQGLGEMGPAAAAAIPALAALLKDKDGSIRSVAMGCLGKIGPKAKTAVPTFVDLLKDEDAAVRGMATGVLKDMGPDAKAAVPALADLLKDEDAAVRGMAVGALKEMGPDAKAAIPALAGLLRDKNPAVQTAAVWALASMGPAAIPALTPLLKDDSRDVRRGAVMALAQIKPEAKVALPAFTGLLKDEDAEVRRSAAWGLVAIGPELKAALPALVELLKDEDAGVRQAAATALGGIGPEAKSAVPALTELRDKDAALREVAAWQLQKIAPPPPRVAPSDRAFTAKVPKIVQQDMQQAACKLLQEIYPGIDIEWVRKECGKTLLQNEFTFTPVNRNWSPPEVHIHSEGIFDLTMDFPRCDNFRLSTLFRSGPGKPPPGAAVKPEKPLTVAKAKDIAYGLLGQVTGDARRAQRFTVEEAGEAQMDFDFVTLVEHAHAPRPYPTGRFDISIGRANGLITMCNYWSVADRQPKVPYEKVAEMAKAAGRKYERGDDIVLREIIHRAGVGILTWDFRTPPPPGGSEPFDDTVWDATTGELLYSKVLDGGTGHAPYENPKYYGEVSDDVIQRNLEKLIRDRAAELEKK